MTLLWKAFIAGEILTLVGSFGGIALVELIGLTILLPTLAVFWRDILR